MYIPIVKSPAKVLGQRDEVKVLYPLLMTQTDADCARIEDESGNSGCYLYDADDEYYGMMRRAYQLLAAANAGVNTPKDAESNEAAPDTDDESVGVGTIKYGVDDPNDVVIYF